MRVRPPLVALIYIACAVAADRIWSPDRLVPETWRSAGVILGCGAVLLVAWALLLFRKRGTTHHPFGEPSCLVMTGPFRFSRNPMYLSVTAALLGIALCAGTVPFLLVPVAFALTMNTFYIPREEKLLEQTFGPSFLDYRRRVRRWL